MSSSKFSYSKLKEYLDHENLTIKRKVYIACA
jgi:hypothetical protein